MFERPDIPKDVLAELEAQGIELVRGLIASSTDGNTGTARATVIPLGHGVSANKGQIADWLKWKASIDRRWHMVDRGVGLVTMAAALIAAILSWLALPK